MKFYGEFKLQKNCYQYCTSKYFFFGLVKMTLGLVHANYMCVQLALMESCKPDFLCTMSRHCDFRHYTIDLIHLIYFVTAVLGLIQAIGRNAS